MRGVAGIRLFAPDGHEKDSTPIEGVRLTHGKSNDGVVRVIVDLNVGGITDPRKLEVRKLIESWIGEQMGDRLMFNELECSQIP